MRNLQKLGGLAALYEAVAYIIGIVFFVLVVDYQDAVNAAQKVALLVDNLAAMIVITLIIYVIFGLVLVVLSLALHERLKVGSPALMNVATTFGLIWAGVVIASGMVFNIGAEAVVELYHSDPTQAATVWLAIDSVVNGIGGGVEVLGGLWLLLVSWAALRAAAFPKMLNYLGVVVGGAGVLTLIPVLGEVGGLIFGLGQIVWFIWLGILMFRHSPDAAGNPDAFIPQPNTLSIKY